MTTKGCINAFRKGLDKEYLKISAVYFVNSENSDTFAFLNENSPARMAESVDALVSNTSGAIRAGSIPAPGTKKDSKNLSPFFVYLLFALLLFNTAVGICQAGGVDEVAPFSCCFGQAC